MRLSFISHSLTHIPFFKGFVEQFSSLKWSSQTWRTWYLADFVCQPIRVQVYACIWNPCKFVLSGKSINELKQRKNESARIILYDKLLRVLHPPPPPRWHWFCEAPSPYTRIGHFPFLKWIDWFQKRHFSGKHRNLASDWLEQTISIKMKCRLRNKV